jgi:hypothetical protein
LVDVSHETAAMINILQFEKRRSQDASQIINLNEAENVLKTEQDKVNSSINTLRSRSRSSSIHTEEDQDVSNYQLLPQDEPESINQKF